MQWLILTLYILFLFILAYFHRKATTLRDYLIANKNQGSWVTALSARTTGESGWLILGVTGMGYAIGLQGLWIVLGETFFVAISWLFMAKKFKRYADQYDSVTVIDYLEDRIKDKMGIVRAGSTLVLLFLVTIYLGAQYAAIGKAFHTFFQINTQTGILIGTIIVCLYTMIGGFKTVALSDFFQGILMIIGLFLVIILCYLTLHEQGINLLTHEAPIKNFWNIWGKNGFGFVAVITAISYFAIGLGFLGVPHIYVRFIAAKNIKTIEKGAIIAIFFTLIGDTAALFMGILGRYLVPHLADSEYIFPLLSKTLFGPLAMGLLVAVVLSAIMSTADSLLILTAGSIIRDIYQKLFNYNIADSKLVPYTKFVIVFISIIAFCISINDSRLVFYMVLFAWSAIASAFNPLIIMSLTKFPIKPYGAISGIIGGCLTSIFWSMYLYKTTHIYEMIPGFIVGFILIIVVSLIEEKFQS